MRTPLRCDTRLRRFGAFASAFPFLVAPAPSSVRDGSAVSVEGELDTLDFLPSAITDSMFLGSDANARSGRCFQPAPAGLGISYVVNAAHECPNYFELTGDESKSPSVDSEATREAVSPPKYMRLDWVVRPLQRTRGRLAPASAHLVARARVRVVAMVQDETSQSILETLPAAVEFVTSAVRRGGRVLVHCHRGRSRSASVVVAALMQLKSWDLDTALRHVRACRPVAQPNDGFMAQLRAVDKSVA